MRILQICNKVPYPEKDGGVIGVSVYTKAFLKAGHTVKILAMNTTKNFVDINSIPKLFIESVGLETVLVNTNIKPVDALFKLISRKSYNVSRFFSTAFQQKLLEVLKNEKFDVVQLEGLYLTPYINDIKANSNAPIILRENNIEWLIWERFAKKESNFLKKRYLKTLTNQLKKYEQTIFKLCDGIITFTVIDMQRLNDMGCKRHSAHIPFGLDLTEYVPAKPEKSPSLFYIGALDWRPNVQGLEWFLQRVWPEINKTYPTLEFHVAGRNMPDKYKTLSIPNVTFHGEVDSAVNFMNKYDIMVIPLLAGSGVRVKIIEGMALQKPIITTGVGIEGIECNYENDVLIANTPEEFYTSVKQCMENSVLAKTIASNGKKYVEANHDINKIINNLLSFYEDAITMKLSAN